MFTLFLACSTPSPEKTPPPPPAPPVPSPAEKAMQEHFELATTARDAIVAGKLSEAKEAVSKLVITQPPGEIWEGPLARMKESATRAALADDLDGVAKELTLTAQVCGDCHQKTNGGPKKQLEQTLATKTQDQPTPGTEGHMVLHAEAADQMWLGLIGPSPALFKQGASVLANAETLHPGVGPANLDDNLHALAGAALQSDAPAQQAELYAEFIATCATCHAAQKE